MLAEGAATNNRVFYTLGPGAIGGILYRDRGGTKYCYHYDRLGNVMAVTDVNGKPYAEYTMDAFGNVLEKGTSTGYYNEHATDPQPYHLTTKERDLRNGGFQTWHGHLARGKRAISHETPQGITGKMPVPRYFASPPKNTTRTWGCTISTPAGMIPLSGASYRGKCFHTSFRTAMPTAGTRRHPRSLRTAR